MQWTVVVDYAEYDQLWIQTIPNHTYTSGNTEMDRLKFIVDHYNELPANLIFVHQYERRFYHDGSLLDFLKNPQLESIYQSSKTPGFWNFNTQLLGSINPHLPRINQSGWWSACMEKYFGPISQYFDFTNNKKAHSQFIVSRERIHSLPYEFYAQMYEWMSQQVVVEDDIVDPVTLTRSTSMDHPCSSYYLNRYLEWTWELIFTSWKSTENIAITLNNGKKIFVVYGAGNYYRNVTDIFVRHFVTPIESIIIPHTQLNNHFGDVISGTVKTLRVHLDNTIFEIDEAWNIIVR